MSTKIYTGVKFHTNNIFELTKTLHELGPQAQKHAVQTLYGVLDKSANDINNLPCREDYLKVLVVFEDNYRENSRQGLRSMVDPDLSITVFPHENQLYGMYFCDWRPLSDWLVDQDIFQEFAYWNNTDPPEDVLEIDWDERREIWDTVLPRNSVPAQRGFDIKLVRGTDVFWDAKFKIDEHLEKHRG